MTTGFLPPQMILDALSMGVFPMAESSTATSVSWYEPKNRGVLFFKDFHLSKSLAKVIRKNVFEVRFDTAFVDVMKACANRPETWINDQIIDSYTALFDLGFAHSVECWQDNQLVGGLYGVSIGGIFAGESMFSNKTNASKVAFCALVDRLIKGGFVLLDTQFLTPHLATLGVTEIPQKEYVQILTKFLSLKASF